MFVLKWQYHLTDMVIISCTTLSLTLSTDGGVASTVGTLLLLSLYFHVTATAPGLTYLSALSFRPMCYCCCPYCALDDAFRQCGLTWK